MKLVKPDLLILYIVHSKNYFDDVALCLYFIEANFFTRYTRNG